MTQETEPTICELIEWLKNTDSSVEARQLQIRASRQLGDPSYSDALVPLFEIVQTKNLSVQVRVCAISCLERIGDEKVGPFLLGFLNDENFEIRGQAAESVGKLAPEGAFDALLPLLETDNPQTQLGTIIGLALLKDARAIPFLRGFLKDEDPYIRGQAAVALGLLKDDASIDAILVNATDENPIVRHLTINGLIRFRYLTNLRTLHTLEAALNDSDPRVRHIAKIALRDYYPEQ